MQYIYLDLFKIAMCVSRSDATGLNSILLATPTHSHPLPPTPFHSLPLPVAPSRPVEVFVLLVNSTSLSVFWGVPATPRGVIEFYQVEYSSNCTATAQMNTSDDSTFTLLTGLSPFAEYSVRVRAFTVEFGNFSSEQRLMTTEDGRWKLDAQPQMHCI